MLSARAIISWLIAERNNLVDLAKDLVVLDDGYIWCKSPSGKLTIDMKRDMACFNIIHEVISCRDRMGLVIND